jgi:hypothetical protein
VDEDVAPLL